MNIYERRNSVIGMEFDRYMREHPELNERIPQNAHIVLLLEKDKDFNEWSTNLAKTSRKGSTNSLCYYKKIGSSSFQNKRIGTCNRINLTESTIGSFMARLLCI